MKNKSIGIFDSGLGGLTVLQELKKQLPKENYIYVGDTAHVPYGNKSKQNIIQFSNQIIEYLKTKNIKLIIAACNTVSSLALQDIQKPTQIPIIDVIMPLKNIINQYSINKIGVIGTYNTIQSQTYSRMIQKYNPNITIYSKACPMFVPIIEAGLSKHKIAKIMAQEYLGPLIKKDIDHLVLGCTHYPILKPTIQKILPQHVKIIDSASMVAKYTQQYLMENNLNNKSKGENQIQIKVTDNTTQFKKEAKLVFNYSINTIHKISI